jgi:hypothetical protein
MADGMFERVNRATSHVNSVHLRERIGWFFKAEVVDDRHELEEIGDRE